MYTSDSMMKNIISFRKIGFFSIFSIFGPKFWRTKCHQRRIFQKIEKKSQKWICHNLLHVERYKVMKNGPICSIPQGAMSDYLPRGALRPPPCRIGHRLLYFFWILHSFEKFQNAIFLKIFKIPSIG